MSLFTHILIYNLVLSVYLYATLALDPRMWLHRMPPAVVAKVPPKTASERRRLIPLGIPFLTVMAGYPVWYTATYAASLAGAGATAAAGAAGTIAGSAAAAGTAGAGANIVAGAALGAGAPFAAGASYWEISGLLFLFFFSFDICDTFILDLLIFCGITPRFIVIEGTERRDYKDVRYHLKSGAKGLIILIIASLVLGAVVFFAVGK